MLEINPLDKAFRVSGCPIRVCRENPPLKLQLSDVLKSGGVITIVAQSCLLKLLIGGAEMIPG